MRLTGTPLSQLPPDLNNGRPLDAAIPPPNHDVANVVFENVPENLSKGEYRLSSIFVSLLLFLAFEEVYTRFRPTIFTPMRHSKQSHRVNVLPETLTR